MTVKKFTDLKGFKDENVAELEALGITTVEELGEALNDEAKVKEIDAAVKPILKDIGYGIDVGRYSKYRPTLHDYK